MLLDEFGGRRLYEGEYELSRKERVFCTVIITLENGEVLTVTRTPFDAALLLQQLPFTHDEYRAVSARIVWGSAGKYRWMY